MYFRSTNYLFQLIVGKSQKWYLQPKKFDNPLLTNHVLLNGTN